MPNEPVEPTIAHAPDKKQMIHGLEHTCSDDHLWQVATICEYVKETGELSLFDEIVPFADDGEATVYEHLKRALNFSAEQVGATGICKGLRADWNDCLNLNCFSDMPGQSFQTTTNKEGKVAESIFIAGLFCLAGRELVREPELLDPVHQFPIRGGRARCGRFGHGRFPSPGSGVSPNNGASNVRKAVSIATRSKASGSTAICPPRPCIRAIKMLAATAGGTGGRGTLFS